MNRITTAIVSVTLLCFNLLANAEAPRVTWYGVNHNVYQFVPQTDTPAPRGYKPVYLSHYGRHGSRTSVDGGEVYESLIGIFNEASAKGILTPQGDSLMREIMQLNDAYKGRVGSLTQRGVAEHRELARRIYARYRPVFRNGSKFIRVESSTTPRCIVSMASFVSTLASIQGDLRFSMETGDTIDYYIKKIYPEEIRRAVKKKCAEINARTEVDTVSILRTLFTDPVAASSICGNVDGFQSRIFDCACLGKACGIEEDMFRYLPDDVIRKWWSHRVRNIYMRNGNSVEYGPSRMENVKPLARVIFAHASEALSEGKVAADLKFGHDFPLLGLVSWFGLEGVGERLDWDDLPEKWSDPMNIPFAGNLQIVVYRKKGSPDLVKFVYNGRERKLGRIESAIAPYYEWEAVKREYMP